MAHRAEKGHVEEVNPEPEADRLVAHDFKCENAECGHEFEEILNLSEIPALRCPVCGGIIHIVIKRAPATDLFSQNLYPYYDRGLGCEVRSKQHRKELCAALGVIPIDGDYDPDRDFGLSKMKRQIEEDDKAYEDYMDEVEHSSAFAGFREARDKGQFGDPNTPGLHTITK